MEYHFSPKDHGGLGIQDLDLNRCLLSNWLFKLINEEGMWQTLLRKNILKMNDHTSGIYAWRFSFLVWTYES
jgi:hypothetical protein